LLKFLLHCHYQVLANFIIFICFLQYHHHVFGCKLGKFFSNSLFSCYCWGFYFLLHCWSFWCRMFVIIMMDNVVLR
jgi:hypothetical protein